MITISPTKDVHAKIGYRNYWHIDGLQRRSGAEISFYGQTVVRKQLPDAAAGGACRQSGRGSERRATGKGEKRMDHRRIRQRRRRRRHGNARGRSSSMCWTFR